MDGAAFQSLRALATLTLITMILSGCAEEATKAAEASMDEPPVERWQPPAPKPLNATESFDKSLDLRITQATVADVTGNAAFQSWNVPWMDAKKLQSATVRIEWKATGALDETLRLSYSLERSEQNRTEGKSPLGFDLSLADLDPDESGAQYRYQFGIHGAGESVIVDLPVRFTIRGTYLGDEGPVLGLGGDFWYT